MASRLRMAEPEGPTMPRRQRVGEDGAAGPACVVCVRWVLLRAGSGARCGLDGSGPWVGVSHRCCNETSQTGPGGLDNRNSFWRLRVQSPAVSRAVLPDVARRGLSLPLPVVQAYCGWELCPRSLWRGPVAATLVSLWFSS